jgi:hypothetical protein
MLASLAVLARLTAHATLLQKAKSMLSTLISVLVAALALRVAQ